MQTLKEKQITQKKNLKIKPTKNKTDNQNLWMSKRSRETEEMIILLRLWQNPIVRLQCCTSNKFPNEVYVVKKLYFEKYCPTDDSLSISNPYTCMYVKRNF